MNPLYPAVAGRAKYRCEYCRAPQAVFNIELEVEHIDPKSSSGTDDEANLALACHACNKLKSNRVSAIDPETGCESPLYHPRKDIWEENFVIDFERASIMGVTPAGRATVALLKMNRERQVEARRLWLQLERFP